MKSLLRILCALLWASFALAQPNSIKVQQLNAAGTSWQDRIFPPASGASFSSRSGFNTALGLGTSDAVQFGTIKAVGNAQLTPVSTIASLKAIVVTALSTNTSVNVLGYSTVADGGGGVFYYDSSSSATDNGGTIIAPTSGTGRWLRSYIGNVINLLWFGADPSGSNTCTAALNSAVGLIAPVNGGIIFIPQGTYKFSTKPNTIDGGITLVGEGIGRTILSRAYTESDATLGLIDMNCVSGRTNGGGGVKALIISRASGTTGGSAINITSTSSVANGLIVIQEVSVSGAGTCNYPLHIDGSAKTSVPQGVRGVNVVTCFFFQADIQGIYAKSVNHLNIVNTGVFGTGGNAVAGLTVDGTSGSPTNNIVALLEFCSSVILAPTGPVSDVFVSATNSPTLSVSSDLSTAVAIGKFASLSGSCPTLTIVGGGFVRTGGNFVADKIGLGGVISPTYSVEAAGAVTGTVTNTNAGAGHVGVAYQSTVADGESFTVTIASSAKLFTIANGGGGGALIAADFKQTTITLLSNPSGDFEASSTPTSGKIGVYKSANSHVIGIKNNTGGAALIYLLSVGQASAITTPAP